MKPTTIQFEYDDAKLEAIRICLADKQTDLNHELEAFMEPKPRILMEEPLPGCPLPEVVITPET